MNKTASKYPAILVLTGASGAGKTTLIEKLNKLAIPGVEGINCDRVKIDVPETAEPSDRQVGVLRYWITKLGKKKNADLAVLDTQIRPHAAREVLDQTGVAHWQIVLVDCDPVIRNERLRNERAQPDLANPQMDCWAAYLRGQADAMRLPIIHTGGASLDGSVETLEAIVTDLLIRSRTFQTATRPTPDAQKNQLMRFSTAVKRDPAIALWMQEHSGKLGAIARRWFEVMRGCDDDVRELLHDGHPTACVGDAAFGYVNAFTAHINVGFFRGAEIADPAGLLEGTGKFMRHVKISPDLEVDHDALTKLIETAYTDIKRRQTAT